MVFCGCQKVVAKSLTNFENQIRGQLSYNKTMCKKYGYIFYPEWNDQAIFFKYICDIFVNYPETYQDEFIYIRVKNVALGFIPKNLSIYFKNGHNKNKPVFIFEGKIKDPLDSENDIDKIQATVLRSVITREYIIKIKNEMKKKFPDRDERRINNLAMDRIKLWGQDYFKISGGK